MTVSPLRVAVLINGTSVYRDKIQSSFVSAISTASAGAQIDFYDPIDAQTYPDAAAYDLIVLSGGTVDPMSDTPWVLKMQAFLRATVMDHPGRKILGVCWGHQTIHVAFEGIVGGIDKAEMGVTSVSLTDAGRSFFPSVSQGKAGMRIHEYHKREVRTPAKRFVALAEGCQAFINEENTTLTIQGHPEMSEELAKMLLGAAPSYMCVDGNERKEIMRSMEGDHDGPLIWRRVVEWVEKN